MKVRITVIRHMPIIPRTFRPSSSMIVEDVEVDDDAVGSPHELLFSVYLSRGTYYLAYDTSPTISA
jgi:hypothetical protein